jgi:hypothetical protein
MVISLSKKKKKMIVITTNFEIDIVIAVAREIYKRQRLNKNKNGK